MVSVSTVVMYCLMYLNVREWNHIYWSQTRFWMALIMGSSMAVVMLAFMLGMYTNKRANAVVISVSAVAFLGSLFLVRSQTTVGDVAYMEAMIPHHSIAVLTSERARIEDPRVRKLADAIIESQRREIAEMKSLIQDLSAHGVVDAAGSR
jgi:uncharacterized protein (DUF305 family)